MVLKHVKKLKISCELFFGFFDLKNKILDPNFILSCAKVYANLHTKFQKNPSMCAESTANTNVHTLSTPKTVLSCVSSYFNVTLQKT